MSIEFEKFKKNTIVLYDPKDEANCLNIAFARNKVEVEFAETKYPFRIASDRLDLVHPDYPVPDVGKAIHELGGDIAIEVGQRKDNDNNIREKLKEIQGGLQDESLRSREAESQLTGHLNAEIGRSKKAEENIQQDVGAEKENTRARFQNAKEERKQEIQDRKDGDARIEGLMLGYVGTFDDAAAKMKGELEGEKNRAMKKESQLQAQIDKQNSDLGKQIADVENEMQGLIDLTEKETLDTLKRIAAELENSDNETNTAITNALKNAAETQKKFMLSLREIYKRIAYIEGVVIQTFENDRHYDNGLALIVKAEYGVMGDGIQSGYYKQYSRKFVLNEKSEVQKAQYPVFLRADHKYCFIYSLEQNCWGLMSGNPALFVGDPIEFFNCELGKSPIHPVSNKAYNVDIVVRGEVPIDNESSEISDLETIDT